VGGRANSGDLEPWGVPNWEGGATPYPVLPPQGGKGPKSPPALSGDGEKAHPENQAQALEKIESAPGIPAGPAAQTPLAPFQPEEGRGEELQGLSVPAGQTSRPDRLPLIRGSGQAKERPEISAQSLEKIESAPGIGSASRTAEAVTGPASAADLMLSLLRSSAGRRDLRVCLAPKQGGGALSLGVPAALDRPENPPQDPENIDFAPGKSGLDEAGSGSLPNPLVPYPIGPGRFYRTLHCVGAC
jgi:hypothetical protein